MNAAAATQQLFEFLFLKQSVGEITNDNALTSQSSQNSLLVLQEGFGAWALTLVR